MELRDLIVTPIIIFLVYTVAYLIRPRVTDSITRKYFFPALTVRILGALALGFIYQFYYDGGDTYNFHTHGSRVIWEAFMEDSGKGFSLLLQDDHGTGVYRYITRIPFYRDPSSYFVIRVAAILDLLTFSTYSATAVLFAALGFIGMWLFFLTFYAIYPRLHFGIAIACFFIPSVFFWGSGLLKDAITLPAIGFIIYTIKKLFIDRRYDSFSLIMLVLGVITIFIVKKYVLLCLFPALLLWIYSEKLFSIRSTVLKILLIPFVGTIMIVSAFWSVVKVGEDDARYSINNISNTAKVTAYDIGFYTGRNAGSGYVLGELDGSFQSMIKLAPQAINVSLFRPYIWEVRNPLMLLSALESILLMLATVYVIGKKKFTVIRSLGDPNILFCLVFSITFAFAVGVSTFNFGTLTRYKIPLLPFYILSLFLIYNYSNNLKKADVLEATE